MSCEHVGPPELIEMAEKALRQDGIATDAWPGSRFRWSENVTGGMWASVVLEVERRGDQWVVTRLDRNREALPESDVGLLRM